MEKKVYKIINKKSKNIDELMQPVVKAACVHSLSRIVQIRTMTVYLSSLGDVFFFFARSLSSMRMH